MIDTTSSSAEREVARVDALAECRPSPGRPYDNALLFALLAGIAFGLYLFSSLALQARNATLHFGADAHLYAPIADGTVYDRVVRFHPVTVALAVAWLSVLKPLTALLSPQVLLKGMFALIGALGVWAATSAFAALMPRRYALLWGAIYATSFGVWYFASMEESKIVTATLCAAYIAVYLRLRERWTGRGAAVLTLILLLACLNEIVSGFLVIVPAVDTLMRHGWNVREGRWIVLHALAGPLALLILEIPINGWLIPEGKTAEGASHVSMLLFYLAQNDYSLSTVYAFVLNWLFFNIAAPTPDARLWVAGAPYYGSYFEPELVNYFASAAPALLAVVFAVLIAAGAWSRYRDGSAGDYGGIVAALASYTLLRGTFFLIFNPREPLLFTPAVTLAHLLIIGLPFAASKFPAKQTILLLAAGLLFVVNGAFIIGR